MVDYAGLKGLASCVRTGLRQYWITFRKRVLVEADNSETPRWGISRLMRVLAREGGPRLMLKQLAIPTYNPLVGGSNPPRPTNKRLQECSPFVL